MDTSNYTATKHFGIKANKDRTQILLDFRLNGKRYRKKISYRSTQGTKADRLDEAYSALELYKDELSHDSTLGDKAKATIDDYFTRTQTRSRSKPLKKALESIYDRYIKEVIGHRLVKDVKPTHISVIYESMAHYSKSQHKKYLEILIPIFAMAIDEEVIAASPIKKIHQVKRNALEEKKVIVDAVTKYKVVHNAIMKEFANKPKIRALILFSFHGRRKMEAAKLKWSDINLNTKTYIIRSENSKVKTAMEFHLPDDIIEALTQIPHRGEYIFYTEVIGREGKKKTPYVTDIRHHIQTLRDATGIDELTLHWFRNLAVSALSASGVNSIALSSLLGHNDTATLNKYLSLQRASDGKGIQNISVKLLGS